MSDPNHRRNASNHGQARDDSFEEEEEDVQDDPNEVLELLNEVQRQRRPNAGVAYDANSQQDHGGDGDADRVAPLDQSSATDRTMTSRNSVAMRAAKSAAKLALSEEVSGLVTVPSSSYGRSARSSRFGAVAEQPTSVHHAQHSQHAKEQQQRFQSSPPSLFASAPESAHSKQFASAPTQRQLDTAASDDRMPQAKREAAMPQYIKDETGLATKPGANKSNTPTKSRREEQLHAATQGNPNPSKVASLRSDPNAKQEKPMMRDVRENYDVAYDDHADGMAMDTSSTTHQAHLLASTQPEAGTEMETGPRPHNSSMPSAAATAPASPSDTPSFDLRRPGAIRVAGVNNTGRSDDDYNSSEDAWNDEAQSDNALAAHIHGDDSSDMPSMKRGQTQMVEGHLVGDDDFMSPEAIRARERLQELEARTQQLEAQRQQMMEKRQDLERHGDGSTRLSVAATSTTARNENGLDESTTIPGVATRTVDEETAAVQGSEQSKMMIVTAEAIESQDDHKTIFGMERGRAQWICSIAFVFIVAGVVIIAVLLTGESDSGGPTAPILSSGRPSVTQSDAPSWQPSQQPTLTPSLAPSSAPSTEEQRLLLERYDLLVGLLYPNITQSQAAAVSEPQSPYNRALWWLVQDDPAKLDFPTLPAQQLLERYIMVATYYQYDGPNWIVKNGWLSELETCNWIGLSCDHRESVNIDQINAPNNGMKSSMLTEMGLLTDLRHLNLSGNEVKGPLISEIGLLTKLTRLDLESAVMFGEIPSELGKLSNLRRLYLGYNDFIGTIPTELNQLSATLDLELLTMVNISVTGDINSIVCNATDPTQQRNAGEYSAQCLPFDDGEPPAVTCDCCSVCCNTTICCDMMGDEACYDLPDSSPGRRQ